MSVYSEIARFFDRLEGRKRRFAGVYPEFWKVPEGAGFTSENYARNTQVRALASRTEQLELGLLRPQRASKIALPLVAALLAQDRRVLRVLDFGGGAGVDASMLAAMPDMDFSYHVVDLDPLIEGGRAVWADKEAVTFSSELPPSERRFDLVYSWSAIQYVQNPLVLLDRFADYDPAAILLVFHPIGSSTFIRGQVTLKVPVPSWVLGVDQVKARLAARGYRLALGAWSSKQYTQDAADGDVGMADLLFLKNGSQ